MPLGTNVINRSLDQKVREDIAGELRDSIKYGVDNFEESLRYARAFQIMV